MSRPTDMKTDAIDPSRPWLGLSSFTERTRALFFGRDQEIHELLDRIDTQPLTVLFGLSGRGKSSLLGAGVVPRLREVGARPVVVRLRHEGQPLVMQVREAWDRAVGCAASDRSLWERAHSRADRDALRAHPPVIVLDQFEEVFTLGQSQGAELQSLFRELAGLVENRVPQELRERLAEDEAYAAQFDEQTTPARVVITLREDYLAQLEAWKGQLPALMRNRMVLHPLNGPQALEAVVQPGRLGASPLVDTDTATAIVRFVAQVTYDTPLEDIQAVPPLLSLLCFELNEARLQSGADRITLGQLEEQGANILQNFYLRCFEGLPETVREAVESPLIVSESGHRNACTYPDLLLALKAGGMPEAEAAAAVARLVDARLLTRERIGGAQRIELTHDLLTALVVRSRNGRRARQQLAALEAEKVEAERRALALEKSRRVLQRWVIASSLMTLLMVTAGGYAWLAERRVRAASSDLRKAQQATTETLVLARRNIDEVLSVLESPEMDQVHGFSPIERELMAKLVPLERQLSDKMGKDLTPAGIARSARLELRAAKELRDTGDQVGAARISLGIHERIRRLPTNAVTSELQEIQFQAISRVNVGANFLEDYDRGRMVDQALAAYRQSHFVPGGQYWRETVGLQIAEHWKNNGRPGEALALLEDLRPALTERVTTLPGDWFAVQTLLLVDDEVANLKVRLNQTLEAKEERRERAVLRESANLRWPRSIFLARDRLWQLFDGLYDAINAKNEKEFARLTREAQSIIDRFRGSAGGKDFEAAEAKLNQVKAEFQRRVKQDKRTSLKLSLESLQLYGDLYAGRSVSLPQFDSLDASLNGVVNSFFLQEQRADTAKRAALRAKHGRELIALSQPFVTCAKALPLGSACSGLVRNATRAIGERLGKGDSKLDDPALLIQLLRDRHAVFLKPALAMADSNRRISNTALNAGRPSTDPLVGYCEIERDLGQALMQSGKVQDAIKSMSVAARRCEAWAGTYDWDQYLRDITSDLMDTLAAAMNSGGQLKESFPYMVAYERGPEQAEQPKPTDDEVKAVRLLLATNGKFQPGEGVSSDSAGVAIGGFDTVDAAIDSEAVVGSARFPAFHAGAIWLFKNDANRKRFERAPDRFMPAFGGFCVARLAAGAKEPGLVRYLVRHEGKLYLACSEKTKETVLRDADATITAASAAWLKLIDAPGTRTVLTPLGKALLEREAAPSDKPKPDDE